MGAIVVFIIIRALEPKTPKIFMMTDEYSLQDLLEQFKGAMEMSSTPVSEIQIITENNAIIVLFCTTLIIFQNINNPSKMLFWFSSKNMWYCVDS
jgi:hypothetical protein